MEKVVPIDWVVNKRRLPEIKSESRSTLDFILKRLQISVDRSDYSRAAAYYRFLDRYAEALGSLADELEELDKPKEDSENVLP